MTPLGIEILLHYHVSPTEFRDGDLSAPAVRAAIDRFRDEWKLLEIIPKTERRSSGSGTYRLTRRGLAYITALQAMPLPECVWIIPPAGEKVPDVL